jgi:predicted nucleotidyltransferase
MTIVDIKEVFTKLGEWSAEAVSSFGSKEVHLFGSLIHKNGVQFGSSSDIDLVLVMPELDDAVSRQRWLQGFLEHKENWNCCFLGC